MNIEDFGVVAAAFAAQVFRKLERCLPTFPILWQSPAWKTLTVSQLVQDPSHLMTLLVAYPVSIGWVLAPAIANS